MTLGTLNRTSVTLPIIILAGALVGLPNGCAGQEPSPLDAAALEGTPLILGMCVILWRQLMRTERIQPGTCERSSNP
jgi:hypothetical protein